MNYKLVASVVFIAAGLVVATHLLDTATTRATSAVDSSATVFRLRQSLHGLWKLFERNGSSPNMLARVGIQAQGNVETRPLLSWRVHILPFIGEETLYRQFKLNEAWDSENNIKLLPQVPKAYGHRTDAKGMTQIVIPLGDQTMNGRPNDVRDGLKYTVMVMEVAADRAVPWTKPVDFEFDAKDCWQALQWHQNDKAYLGMADGNVRTVGKSINQENLPGLFTRAGGEVVTGLLD
jgi:hypothetical protein